MKKYLIGFSLGILGCTSLVCLSEENKNGSKVITVAPAGEFKNIDVNKSNEAIQRLRSKDSKIQAAESAEMEKNLGDYNPRAIVQLAVYFRDNQQYEKAARYFWFAQLRCEIDIIISQDNSVSGVHSEFSTAINTFESSSESIPETLPPEIEKKMDAAADYFRKPEKMEEIINLDKKTPRNYDQRWIMFSSHHYFATAAGLEDHKLFVSSPQLVKDAAEQAYKKILTMCN